jgi:hypothetical protein
MTRSTSVVSDCSPRLGNGASGLWPISQRTDQNGVGVEEEVEDELQLLAGMELLDEEDDEAVEVDGPG